MLQFQSSDRSRMELAARLLRLAGVNAEVKKVGGKYVWYVKAAADMLAAGRLETPSPRSSRRRAARAR